MSLILKGIDMPKDDDFISLEIHKGEYRIYYAKGATIKEERGEAIQIDRPHGRLIDGGWVKYNLENYSDLPTKYLHMDLVREAIDDAPTIIEAEE